MARNHPSSVSKILKLLFKDGISDIRETLKDAWVIQMNGINSFKFNNFK